MIQLIQFTIGKKYIVVCDVITHTQSDADCTVATCLSEGGTPE